jgi:phospholipid-binding lipoprotein MlaA
MPSFSTKSFFFGIGFAVAVLGLAGCATPPPADDPDAVADYNEANDPLEPTNRFIFDANIALDDAVLHPAALRYRENVPQFGRDRIANILANLKSPIIFFSDVLQGDGRRAIRTLKRLVLNSTFGVGGFMDVATPMGIPRHDSDFGETLGVWGIGEGPYLVLPLLGPSDVRDSVGSIGESFADPLQIYLQDNHMRWVSDTEFLIYGVSTREAYLDTLDDVRRTSLDYYSALRSLYRQRREAQIAEKLNSSGTPSTFFVRMLPHIQLNF